MVSEIVRAKIENGRRSSAALPVTWTALNAIRFKREAEAKGLQGREKHEYLCQGLGLSKQTDERTPRRWAEEAEKLGL